MPSRPQRMRPRLHEGASKSALSTTSFFLSPLLPRDRFVVLSGTHTTPLEHTGSVGSTDVFGRPILRPPSERCQTTVSACQFRLYGLPRESPRSQWWSQIRA